MLALLPRTTGPTSGQAASNDAPPLDGALTELDTRYLETHEEFEKASNHYASVTRAKIQALRLNIPFNREIELVARTRFTNAARARDEAIYALLDYFEPTPSPSMLKAALAKHLGELSLAVGDYFRAQDVIDEIDVIPGDHSGYPEHIRYTAKREVAREHVRLHAEQIKSLFDQALASGRAA